MIQPTTQLEEGSYFHTPNNSQPSKGTHRCLWQRITTSNTVVSLPWLLQYRLNGLNHHRSTFHSYSLRHKYPFSLSVQVSRTQAGILAALLTLLLFDCLFIASNIKIFTFERAFPPFLLHSPTLPTYSPREREETRAAEVVVEERGWAYDPQGHARAVGMWIVDCV